MNEKFPKIKILIALGFGLVLVLCLLFSFEVIGFYFLKDKRFHSHAILKHHKKTEKKSFSNHLKKQLTHFSDGVGAFFEKRNLLPEDLAKSKLKEEIKKRSYYINERRGSRVQYLVSGKSAVDKVTGHFDEFSRRKIDFSENLGRQKHLVFFGGSFTEGEGVKDEEVFTYQLAKSLKNHSVYNYGVRGGGPFDFAAKIATEELSSEIPQASGHVIYVWITEHARRLRPSITNSPYIGMSPYFQISKLNLTYKGLVKENFKSKLSFLKFLQASHFLEKTRINYILEDILYPDEYLKSCKVLTLLKTKILNQFPKTKFSIASFPGLESTKNFYDCLKKNKVNVLMFEPAKGEPEDYTLVDNHPSSRLHKYFAEQLVKKMELD